MALASFLTAAVFAMNTAVRQPAAAETTEVLPPSTTISITFMKSVDANHVHVGDPVSAQTTQIVKLPDGQVVRAGSQVIGHVVTDIPFELDRTPYAEQKQSRLGVHFDRIVDHGQQVPLTVYVRALADSTASWAAKQPTEYDDDLHTSTQIGGDQLTPSRKGIVAQSGDVVSYQHRGGVYAHLIANRGSSPNGCDSTDTEQSMNIFSASACGLYGFVGVSLAETGLQGAAGTVLLESDRRAPKIWAHSNALLEVMPSSSGLPSRMSQ
jgi:hypothetical protein